MFTTARLLMRGITQNAFTDASNMHNLYNDPKVAPWIRMDYLAPRHGTQQDELIKKTENAVLGLIVQEKGYSGFVGIAGFLPEPASDLKNRHVALYIALTPGYWGEGFAYETVECLLKHAFWEMGMHKVSLKVVEDNERGIKLFKKFGFAEEGRDREVLWSRGAWKDMIRMGILESEWKQWVLQRNAKNTDGAA